MYSPSHQKLASGRVTGIIGVSIVMLAISVASCVPALPSSCTVECALMAAAQDLFPDAQAGTGRIVVSPTAGLSTDEFGSTAFFTVVLDQEPSASVVLNLQSDDASEGTPSPGVLTFTGTTWSTPQTVTVTGADDALPDGNQTYTIVTTPVESADARFNGVDPADVALVNQDNDSPNVIVTQSGGTTAATEGGATDSYSLVLATQPAAAVTITVTPNAQVTANGSAVPINLAFTSGACPGPGNWCTPQTVTVAAVDDAIAEGGHAGSLAHSAASVDPGYNAIPVPGVSVTLSDNDSAGVTIVEAGGTSATEGGAGDTYTVVLDSQPTSAVTVSVAPNAQVTANGSATPINLTFTAGACPGPGNWCTPQTVTVAAVDDALAEGTHSGAFTHSATSADPTYNGIAIAAVNATITDNDAPGVSIVESGGSTTATEGGGTDTYTVVLSTQPIAPVTVTVTPDLQVTANASLLPIALTFTAGACPGPGNWCTPQTVTVAAVNDVIAEGAHSGTLTHAVASADLTYNGIATANVSATLTDNDVAAVSLVESGGSTAAAEGGASDTYTLVLATQPLANVTIAVTPDAQVLANGSATPVNLVFTAGACPGPGNWCTAQTVTVAAQDDGAIEGNHTGAISHAATSADPAYNGIGIGGVTASITDNDASYRMFVTTASHNGGFDVDATLAGGTFGAVNADGNGIPEADNFCDTDAANPAGGAGAFRALLVDGTNRIASVAANAGDGQVNWVLQANAGYVRLDGTTPVFTTNANRVFVFGALTNSTGTGALNYWTGLNADWTTSSRHCANWQLNTGGANQGERGLENVTDSTAVGGAGGNRQCNQLYHLLCVEQ